jgi:hypothetical protein
MEVTCLIKKEGNHSNSECRTYIVVVDDVTFN